MITHMEWEFVDDNGYLWIFDGRRVYMLEAEIEMALIGDADQNGYPCTSLIEAKDIMVEGGYITEELKCRPIL